MIRTLRLSDLLRLPAGLPGGEDLACSASGERPVRLSALRIVRWVGAPRGSTEPVTVTSGGRLEALAVLTMRSGQSAWSVAHLFANAGARAQLPSLLAVGVARAASHRAERLFLRVPEGGPLREQAVQAGFSPCWQERRFVFSRPLAPVGSASLNLRPQVPADALGLFRLNAACVPAPVRASTGLTLEQWQDAQEPSAPGARSYVWERAGELRGWVRLAHQGDRLVVDALAHPAEGQEALAALVDDVVLLARDHRQAEWALPDHQRALAATLSRRGWTEQGRCEVLAATTGIRVPLTRTVAAGV